MRKLLWAGILASIPSVLIGSPDLDLEVPTGTPLDWDKELHQPTPVISTGTPGRAVAKEPAAVPGTKGHTGVQTVTPTPVPPPTMGFSVPNLYNFFRVTTVDIMNHLQVNPGTTKPVPWEPAAQPPGPAPVPSLETGGAAGGKPKAKFEPIPNATLRHGVVGAYPPRVPGELAWMAIATSLRTQLHPEIVNKGEGIAYLLEVGEVAAMNDPVKLITGKIAEIPAKAPPFPSMNQPIDKMLSKIIVLEICSGYPYAMDPTYAKNTLMMGELSLNTILECTKSQHTLLAHNAVAILANFQGQKAGDELLKLFETSGDPCIKVRAASGLARKRFKKALPALMNAVGTSDEGINAMVIYSLGQIAAAAEEKDKVNAAKKLASMVMAAAPDVQWSLLASIARIGAKDKSVADAVLKVKAAIKAKADASSAPPPPAPPQAPGRVTNPDVPGTKNKIIYQAAVLAAAASGDDASKTEACSLGIGGFHKSLMILAAEVFPNLGDAGIGIAKGLSGHDDHNVAVAAVRALGRSKENLDWLKGVAAGARPIVRAAALCSLYGLDEKATEEACKPIVAGYSASAKGEDAFLVGIAIQMLDRMNKNDGATILKVVQTAKAAGHVAKRTATDEYDVTKAKIDVFPPLLEVAVLALGKTQHEPGVDELISLLEPGSPVRGEAALSLGSFGKAETLPKVSEALLKALVEPSEGFVRFCAYLSLKNLSGKDYSADYVFGTISDIWPSVLKYRDWIVETREKAANSK